MKKLISLILILSIFTALTVAIVPVSQAAENNTIATSANIQPAKGLEPEDMPQSNVAATSSLPETGLTNMMLIAIIVVSLIAVGSFVRAKTIKLD